MIQHLALLLKNSRVSFNPLNQVYVFNPDYINVSMSPDNFGFNPLNQVYVFNTTESSSVYGTLTSQF